MTMTSMWDPSRASGLVPLQGSACRTDDRARKGYCVHTAARRGNRMVRCRVSAADGIQSVVASPAREPCRAAVCRQRHVLAARTGHRARRHRHLRGWADSNLAALRALGAKGCGPYPGRSTHALSHRYTSAAERRNRTSRPRDLHGARTQTRPHPQAHHVTQRRAGCEASLPPEAAMTYPNLEG